MDTTRQKALVRAGKADYTHTPSGMTKLLVGLPLQDRQALAELAKAKGASQQELVRFAISALLEDPSQFVPASKPTKAEPAKAKKAKPEPVMISQPEPTLNELIAPSSNGKPVQPSPDHVWVKRGQGGYWRRAKRTGE